MSKIKNLNTNTIYTYITILSQTRNNIEGFYVEMEKFLDKKVISKKFFDSKREEITAKLNRNESIIDNLEKELFERMKKDLGSSIVLPSFLETLDKQQRVEYEKQEKINKKSALEIQKAREKPKLKLKK